MSTFENQTAWITAPKARPLEVGPGPTPTPGENDVVIQVRYVAINPVDWKIQDNPTFEFPYPFVLGADVAGTIVQLGSKVTRFKLGQRVIGHCDAYLTQKSDRAGFQLYTVVREILVSAVPSSLPLSQAAVLPLCYSTASSALYVQLDLPLPSLTPKPTGKRILLWGGSSSVGSSAIQLAVASGLEVVTTASSVNHEYVKSLGATHVFDHKDADVIDKIVNVLKPGDYVVDCITNQATQVLCGEVLGKIGGGKLPLMFFPEGQFPENVQTSFVNGLDPGMVNLDVGDAVWQKYLPEALRTGKFQAKPDPFVITGGLEKVQEGIDILRQGVSAKKVVIEVASE
ncbi:alcohol dehydrogenase [Penicillium hispanicum]|uniref:alcohol dehydrogenase n=1 Tax=Penicillium hispanicum TaxID=1080232 RepID=UPI00253F679E|nr:alcohol dehydrogenase [Penicillium hispanicum]KAJ5587305.1 alcohol dehydrogenase [Penicillium hispanicum]